MENENIGVEVQEVAEPEVTGVEEQEVAEPDVAKEGVKTEADAAFARQRRAMEDAERRAAEAERRVAEMEAEQNARREAMRRMTGSDTGDIDAIAENAGVDSDDILAVLESEQAAAKKDLEIQRLQNEVNAVRAEKAMQEDLKKIQEIDPEVKDLSELGDSYPDFIKAGLSAEDAYYACKAKEGATSVTPPKPIGKVNNEPPEKSYYTEAEVNAMSSQEKYDNAEKIMASLKFWKR